MNNNQYYNFNMTLNRFMKNQGLKYRAVVLYSLKQFPELEAKLQNLNSSTEFSITEHECQNFVFMCKEVEKKFNTRFSAFCANCVSDGDITFDLHNEFGRNEQLFESLMFISDEEFDKFLQSCENSKKNQNLSEFSKIANGSIDFEKVLRDSQMRTYS